MTALVIAAGIVAVAALVVVAVGIVTLLRRSPAPIPSRPASCSTRRGPNR